MADQKSAYQEMYTQLAALCANRGVSAVIRSLAQYCEDMASTAHTHVEISHYVRTAEALRSTYAISIAQLNYPPYERASK